MLELIQDPISGTDRFMLIGKVDDVEYGIFGFCYSYRKDSPLRKKNKESFFKAYSKTTPSYRRGERSTYLVGSALNAIPGLEVEYSDWSSKADCGLKWDLILHYSDKDIFFPVQVKSSIYGILRAVLNPKSTNPRSYRLHEKNLNNNKARMLEKFKREIDKQREKREYANEIENFRKPSHGFFDKEAKKYKELGFDYAESIPIYVWVNADKADLVTKEIITLFLEVFNISCDHEEVLRQASNDFRSHEKDMGISVKAESGFEIDYSILGGDIEFTKGVEDDDVDPEVLNFG
jgi:hypothetical protein